MGSLDEGSALWVIPVGFGEPVPPRQSWAEATDGSKLYHKVFFGNPNLLLVAHLNPSPKLIEVYRWLAATILRARPGTPPSGWPPASSITSPT